ncbi:mercury(II) reductase [Beggiatoa alba]|nr:mercury(II) reductase [Beggiatoa alba]
MLHIAIVGTGSGAFAAAIEAAQRGARVTIIEACEVIGGTCVNTGCVPSKILIHGAHIAHQQDHHAVAGVPLNTPVIDRKAMVVQQQAWVEKLRFEKYENILEMHSGITLLRGQARFQNTRTLLVDHADGTVSTLLPDRILLAVGASPFIPDINGLSDTPYWTSTEALVAEKIPQHLIVLGSSVVALELAQAYRHLGAKVTVLARRRLLMQEDLQLAEGIQKIFTDEGIDVMLHTTTQSIHHDGQQFMLATNHGEVFGERLLIATGRRSNTRALNLEKSGVETDAQDAIVVDKHMRTNMNNISAVGDCTNQPQFVYVAAAAGTCAARNMTGSEVSLDLSVIPAVIFTHPQIATVGLSLQQAKQQGLKVQSRTLELANVPRALANMDTRGFIKLVAEKEQGRIVGCQVLAAEGGEIIQTAALAISHRMSIEDLTHQLFPYLTMAEGLKLCAQTFDKDVKQLSCCAG